MTLIKNIQAGELKKQLDKTEWENLTDLTVIGPIDFSDWQFLGSMAHKQLRSIDLSQTTGLRMTGDLNHIFYGSTILNTVSLPEGVTYIDEKCFEDCVNLETIKLPDSLNNIGSYAFLHCGLKEIHLPNKLRRFGPRTFADCSNLKKAILPDEL